MTPIPSSASADKHVFRVAPDQHAVGRAVDRSGRPSRVQRVPFHHVIGLIWRPVLVLALATMPFATMAAFRGQLLVWSAPSPLVALTGATLTGLGFSLVLPAMGVLATQSVPPWQCGRAVGNFAAFADIALAVTGPGVGLRTQWCGISAAFLVGAGATITALCLISTIRLARSAGTADGDLRHLEPKACIMKLTDNTILITGGTSGIGRALAEAFHDRGNRVIVAGRRQALLDEIAAERPGINSLPLHLDDAESISKLAATIRERFPALNVVIANAGVSRTEDLASDPWDMVAAQVIVDTNIMGVLRTVGALLPIIKGQPGATVMATSSALAFVPRADFPTYCASKAFLHSWLQSLRHQLHRIPVEVLELSPPYVQTELTGTSQASDPRAMPLAAYVAEVMRKLEQADHPRGEVLLERDEPRRWAERDGSFNRIFAAMNPD